jgi:hypothetical protein
MRTHRGRLSRECRDQASEFADRAERPNLLRDQQDIQLQIRLALLHGERVLRLAQGEDITAWRSELIRLKLVGDQAGRLIRGM